MASTNTPVAGLLVNTPAVCRVRYIHPAVFHAYEDVALPSRLNAEARELELALIKIPRAAT